MSGYSHGQIAGAIASDIYAADHDPEWIWELTETASSLQRSAFTVVTEDGQRFTVIVQAES